MFIYFERRICYEKETRHFWNSAGFYSGVLYWRIMASLDINSVSKE